MDYLLFTPLVWFMACCTALFCFTIFRKRESPVYADSQKSQGRVLSKLFSLYLLVHIISNLMILIAYLFPVYQVILRTLGGLVVALAAPVYVVLSSAMIFRGQFLALKKSIFVSFVSYVPFVLVYISLPLPSRNISLFIYYFLSATFAYIGTWIVFCRHGWKAEKPELQAYLLLFASTFGIVNFLLPAFAFLQKENVEELSFIARILDSIFYLPIALFCMIWLDKKREYNISHVQGTTSCLCLAQSKRESDSSISLHKKVSLDWIATDSETNKK